MTRRNNFSERRKPAFTVSTASYEMAKSSEYALTNRLEIQVNHKAKKQKPVLVLSFHRTSQNFEHYICEIDDIRIRVLPDRKNKRFYFAAIYYQEQFLFGASDLNPLTTLTTLFNRPKWLYYEATWFNLISIFKKIVLSGLNVSSFQAGKRPVVYCFDRSHLASTALWHWESPAMERKMVPK